MAHNTLHNIAMCYGYLGDTEKALEYYAQSLDERKALKDTLSMLYSYINIGVLYMGMDSTQSALEYFDLSAETARAMNDQRVLGYAKINRTDIYFDEGEYDKGIQAAQAAQAAFRASGNTRMEQMGILAESRMHGMAGDYAKALELDRKYQDTSIVPDNLFYLSRYYDRMHNAHKGLGNYDSALVYLELKHEHDLKTDNAGAAKELESFESEKRALQDSIKAAEEKAVLQAQHEETVGKKNRQRNWLIGGALLILALAIGLYRRWKRTRKEKDASEELLDNILPSEISAQIKAKGYADSRHIENVTILFTDFKGFTTMAESMDPKALVEDLNVCFSEFDRIMEEFGIEKIKTIGDAYMAAGGLEGHDKDHTSRVIQAALKMRDFIEEGKAKKIEKGLPYFEIRLGIHTGPVVAGIVGVKKFQYDIWGDTVNTASRMESSGEAGKVNISQVSYHLVRDIPSFSFESRGKIAAKGKGEMEMYFVEPS
jgi:class 3 adenylate cyclase